MGQMQATPRPPRMLPLLCARATCAHAPRRVAVSGAGTKDAGHAAKVPSLLPPRLPLPLLPPLLLLLRASAPGAHAPR